MGWKGLDWVAMGKNGLVSFVMCWHGLEWDGMVRKGLEWGWNWLESVEIG